MMVGIIWYIQLVQYPLFLLVTKERFPLYHSTYMIRINFIILPTMIAEILTAALLVINPVVQSETFYLILGLILWGNWLITWKLTLPIHKQLQKEWNPAKMKQLVSMNWSRTTIWTLRGIILTLFTQSS